MMFSQLKRYIPYPVRRRIWLSRLFLRSLSAPWRIWPSFIIIGAQKAGTTSLYRYLVQHPQILPAVEKEIRFFDHKFHRGQSWYRAHFPLNLTVKIKRQRCGGKVITGEASPNYMFDPRSPHRLVTTLPGIKLIVMLRNPVDRAYSGYQMGVRRGWETLSFSQAIAAEADRIKGEWEKTLANGRFIGMNRHNYGYLERGKYAAQLEKWLFLFSREQILFVKSETFFTKPSQVIAQLFDFLELPAHEAIDYRPANVGNYEDLDTETRMKLYDYFRPHNTRLYQLLGIDFGWESELIIAEE